jgi:hypothetical protein
MKLKKEKIKTAFIRTKLKCLACDGEVFRISPNIYAIEQYFAADVHEFPALFPFVIAICENCGATLLFSAIQKDLINHKGRIKE